MKGRFSRKDETKLSFQVVTLDPVSRTMTVRECLWNCGPGAPGGAGRLGRIDDRGAEPAADRERGALSRPVRAHARRGASRSAAASA